MVKLAGVPVHENEDLARRPAEIGDLLQRLRMHARLLVHFVGGVFGDPLLQQVENRCDRDSFPSFSRTVCVPSRA